MIYGWDCDLSESSGNAGCRDRGLSTDLIADSPFHPDRNGLCTGQKAEWSINVRDGPYYVELDFADT